MRKVREITIVLLMIISLFSMLVIMNVPVVKATNDPVDTGQGYWETPNDDWIIDQYDDDLWENKKIVVNGNLTIEEDGILTLSNVTLQMNATTGDAGDYIHVEPGGELNVINGSIITTDPITPAQSPDPYEFRIDGTALINDSIVEKMDDLTGESDGIQIYSSNVTITKSSIRLSDGNGLYIYNAQPTIKNTNISYNSHHGVYMNSTSNCIFENNNVSSNDYGGIYLYNSDYNIIANSTVDANGGSNFPWGGSYLGYGIILKNSNYNDIVNSSVCNTVRAWIGWAVIIKLSSHNSLKNNTINSNDDLGIMIEDHSNNNLIENNSVNFNKKGGIKIRFSSSNNIISNNNASSSGGPFGWGISVVQTNYNTIRNNIVSSNYRYGMYIAGASYILIKDNYCFNNGYHGIYVTSNGSGTQNVKIENNSIHSNGFNGIFLFLYSAYTNCSKHFISNNTIYSNGNNGIYLSSSHNNTITTNNISTNTLYGICLSSSNDNKIGMNNISSNTDGINLTSSSDGNLITSNDLFYNTNYGFYFGSSDDNSIIDNTLTENDYGASLDSSSDNNLLYHNNFKNDVYNASDSGSNNQWDNGLEGNWWAGWADNPDVTDSDGNGICEQSYSNNGVNDNKPLFYEDNDRVLVDDPWFWFIQSGINFADPGMTVYATSSTYLENVTINKTLTVIGEDRNSTIIDARGNESVVLVDSASYVNISGFAMKNGTNGISLNVNSNFTHIFNNNVLYNTFLGVNISQSSNVIIENNTISYNENGLISYNSSPVIRYNNISNNYYTGIRGIYYSNAIVGNNTITYNNYGIDDFECSNGSIDNNTISYNNVGIVCGNYSCPIITYNNVTFNDIAGVTCKIGSNATVHWNNIHNNTYMDLQNGDINIVINATNNYWGKPTGPVWGDDIRGPGPVIYVPYVTNPIEEAGPG